MDTFYLIVLGAASLILILMLAFMGWTISNARKTTRYPAITTTCPDNWNPVADVNDNKKVFCQRPEPNKYNYGNNTLSAYMTVGKNVDVPKDKLGVIAGDATKMDFNAGGWSTSNMDPTCAKKAWAEKYNITWDSVTNASYCS